MDAAEASLVLADDLGFERAVAVARDLDVDRADIGDHGLGPGPVPRVPTVAALHGVFLIADVGVHLTLEAGLEHATREVAEQAARTGEFHPLGLGSLDELLGGRAPDQPHSKCWCRTWVLLSGEPSLTISDQNPVTPSFRHSRSGTPG